MNKKPYIVTVAGSIADFRSTLLTTIPEAGIARELSGGRVVVVLPAEVTPDRLGNLPLVTAVVADELRTMLPVRPPGGAKS